MFSPLLQQLIDDFRALPGVGPKSAQRMALFLLERQRDAGTRLSHSLFQAMEKIKRCEMCQTFCETSLCAICQNPKREPDMLCVVESPADLLAIEQSHHFRGLYFVLGGHLSPLDGIGPKEIGIDQLQKRLEKQCPREMILATNSTVEGEATAHYLVNFVNGLQKDIHCSRIAHGVPVGGELIYLDSATLSRAFAARRPVEKL